MLEPDPAKPPPSAGSLAMAEWVDRNAPLAARPSNSSIMLRDRRPGDGHRPLVLAPAKSKPTTARVSVRPAMASKDDRAGSRASSAAELNRHNYLYYVEAKPEISDREYDRMMERLTELEAEHPELVTAGQPDPAGRRPAARRLRDRPPRRPDALDRQHLFLRRAARVGRAGAQGAEPPASRCATSSSSRSTAWPSRCDTSTASSCRARPAATASAATTSRPT